MVRYSSTHNMSDVAAFYVNSAANKKTSTTIYQLNITNLASYQFLRNSDFNYEIHHNNK